MPPDSDISKRRYHNDRQYDSKDLNLLEVFFLKTSGYFIYSKPEWNDPGTVERSKDQRIDTVVVAYLGKPMVDVFDHTPLLMDYV